MNHISISWSHKTKICKASIFHKLFFPKYDISADDICLSNCLKSNLRLNNERIKLSFFTKQSFFVNSNTGLNKLYNTLIYTNCRACLYETWSELKPIWNLEHFCLHGNFTVTTFQAILRFYFTCAHDIF